MPKLRRARCLYCGKLKPVTPSGRIRAHYVLASPASATVKPGERVLCGGTGRPA